jgi:hypothetical protein
MYISKYFLEIGYIPAQDSGCHVTLTRGNQTSTALTSVTKFVCVHFAAYKQIFVSVFMINMAQVSKVILPILNWKSLSLNKTLP